MAWDRCAGKVGGGLEGRGRRAGVEGRIDGGEGEGGSGDTREAETVIDCVVHCLVFGVFILVYCNRYGL